MGAPEANNAVNNSAAEEKNGEKLAEVIESVAQHVNKFNELSRAEMVEKMRELLQVKPISAVREQIENLKQSFYKKLKIELEAKLSDAPESDELAAETAEQDALEIAFKELLGKYRELKAAENAI